MAGYSGTPLVKKIGIKPGHRVALVNPPQGFRKELEDLPEAVKFQSPGGTPLDVVLFFTKSKAELVAELAKLRAKIAANGMIWAAWPKKASGVATGLTEDVVRQAGLEGGLVDIKVCAVNDVWSGLKFVIPVKMRAQAGR